jgi:hypothetical protein
MSDLDADGCALDFSKDPTPDENLDYVVLFAGVAPEDIEKVAEEYKKVFAQ